jgi:Holliday junction DNA helicase RuvA
MFYSLKGTVHRLAIPQIAIDVSGVAYLVTVPYPLWDSLSDGADTSVIIYTYVREDRLDLFGFADQNERAFFTEILNLSGVGPKLAVELCSMPRELILQAVNSNDTGILTRIKGVGKKTAEKLLVDLKSLSEKHPEWLTLVRPGIRDSIAAMDSDAIAALTSLGYDQPAVVEALQKLPVKIKKTEDRVAAVLRSL